MQLETIFAFLSASALLAIMPGPDVIYVITQSITNGKKYGIATALGLVSGVIMHTSLIAFGISEIIKRNTSVFLAIKIFGALYLFYLAYQVYKIPTKLNLSEKVSKKSLFKLVKQGFIMNVLNPKVTLFFLAFFPAFINYSLPNIKEQIVILGILFTVQSFIIFSILAILADKMTSVLIKNTAFEKSLRAIQITVFISLGIFILI